MCVSMCYVCVCVFLHVYVYMCLSVCVCVCVCAHTYTLRSSHIPGIRLLSSARISVKSGAGIAATAGNCSPAQTSY